MTTDILAAFAAFAFAASMTPGPNNIMLMASGASFGLRRTVPHMLGVAIGFSVLVILTGLGLSKIFDAFPLSYFILKVFSVAYLLYFACKIATSDGPRGTDEKGVPMTFIQAALFQWVNPKAWVMALTAFSAYGPSKGLGGVLLIALIFAIMNLPAIGAWTILGLQMQRLLRKPATLRAFNIAMGLLLVASLYPVLFD